MLNAPGGPAAGGQTGGQAGEWAVSVAAVERARVAVGVVFAMSGLGLASWLSRTPAIRDALELSVSGFGLLLLCVSAGSVSALPLSGLVVHRIGPARTVLAGSLLVATGLVALAGSVALGLTPLAGVGFVLTGVGISVWDVAMNVEGADVERRLGRTLMPRFHAGFSIGTVGGALLGAGAAAGGLPVSVQLIGTSVLLAGAVAVAVPRFLPVVQKVDTGKPSAGVLAAWREPRTVLIGVLVLAFAFAEGVANDWITIAMVDGHHASEAVGAIGFGAFVAAMTAGRMYGGPALHRWGRVGVLRCSALLVLVGGLLVVFGSLPLAFAGALCWGAGAALGFPIGMSAAADGADRAAARVSVVSSIGYTAFLAGPPLVGFLAQNVGILRALLVVLAASLIGLVVAPATVPHPRTTP